MIQSLMSKLLKKTLVRKNINRFIYNTDLIFEFPNKINFGRRHKERDGMLYKQNNELKMSFGTPLTWLFKESKGQPQVLLINP